MTIRIGDSILSTSAPIFSDISNRDLSNLTEQGEKHFLNKSQITNCLLEVPQRIKYDLTDGTLTIKAGSVVIVPYGTEDLTADYPVGSTFVNNNFKVYDTQFADGKFFVWAELQGDRTLGNIEATGTCFVFVKIDNGNLGAFYVHVASSGIVDGTGATYRTDLNKCWFSSLNLSLPLAIVNYNSNVLTSIDQVFNGMGYIGSTWWLENLEGLGANGYNADGTYKNVQHKLNGIVLETIAPTANVRNVLGVFDNLNRIGAAPFKEVNSIPTEYTTTWLLNKINNRIYEWDGSSYNIKPVAIIPDCTFDVINGVISNFQPKLPFRAVDYSDSSTVSSWGMPSSKYIDLTLGASGSTYTAPANGWFSLIGTASANFQFVNLTTANMGIASFGASSSKPSCFLPVKKGEVVTAWYTVNSITNFKFIYAEGEVS